MRMLNDCLHKVLTVLYFAEIIHSDWKFIANCLVIVPIDYCLHPLNRSDCNLKPTPVFSYYKPGSRCEIETWRGCPTLNKFENEYECTHYCIFSFKKAGGILNGAADNIDEIMTEIPSNDLEPKKVVLCEEILNTAVCNDSIDVNVYTYSEGDCKEVNWHGCYGNNKFPDLMTCLEACSNEEPVYIEKLSANNDCTYIEIKAYQYTEGYCKEVTWQGCAENSEYPKEVLTCLKARGNMDPECSEKVNTEICTHNNTKDNAHIEDCKQVALQDCNGDNLFPDLVTCLEVCGNGSIIKWEDDLKKLTEEQVGKLDEILDELIDTEDEPIVTVKNEEEIVNAEVEETTQFAEEETEIPVEEVSQQSDMGEVSEVLITRQKNNETGEHKFWSD